jgi:hypothetical protein
LKQWPAPRNEMVKSSRDTTKELLASGAKRSPRLTFCRPAGMAQLVGRNSEDL